MVQSVEPNTWSWSVPVQQMTHSSAQRGLQLCLWVTSLLELHPTNLLCFLYQVTQKNWPENLTLHGKSWWGWIMWSTCPGSRKTRPLGSTIISLNEVVCRFFWHTVEQWKYFLTLYRFFFFYLTYIFIVAKFSLT